MPETIRSIIETNSIYLPVNTDFIRKPPRPAEDQQPNYLERFDFHGIFSDVFSSGNSVIAVGPPFLNLRNLLGNGQFLVNGATCIEHDAIKFEELDRTSRTTFDLPSAGNSIATADTLTFKHKSLDLQCKVGQNHHQVFAGRNVLLTMNRDNFLENIVDWVTINAAANEIDAVIIYDNRSELYTKNELLQAIASVPGIEVAYVVNWPHPYGPTAYRQQLWDSDFGQYTAWEHARWRFLSQANSVTPCDVDEIPLTEDGSPCWHHAHQSEDGVFYYRMRDIEPAPLETSTSSRIRRHSDYGFYNPDKLGSFKYTYVPSRLSTNQQVLVHKVSDTQEPNHQLGFTRHFRGLHRQWRAGVQGYTFDELELDESFVKDTAFSAALKKVSEKS